MSVIRPAEAHSPEFITLPRARARKIDTGVGGRGGQPMAAGATSPTHRRRGPGRPAPAPLVRPVPVHYLSVIVARQDFASAPGVLTSEILSPLAARGERQKLIYNRARVLFRIARRAVGIGWRHL